MTVSERVHYHVTPLLHHPSVRGISRASLGAPVVIAYRLTFTMQKSSSMKFQLLGCRRESALGQKSQL